MRILDDELSGLVDHYNDWAQMKQTAEINQDRLKKQIIRRMPTNIMTVGDRNGYFAKIIKTKNGLVIKEICDGK